ncbi:peptidase inhibitor family I36 protein [Streptomyces sp. NPDC006798]|uniref:peptidase inhibitor family I36 protein n=1 Tax=Streptomyces sp. NPDC006798 TaxID=3155462 RepID=UPI0033FFE271
MATVPAVLRRPVAAFAALGLAVAALLVAPAAPASAAAANPPGVHILNQAGEYGPECPTGWFCLFNGLRYTWWSFAALPGTDIPDLSSLKFSNGASIDGSWSYSNRTLLTYCVYSEPDYRGNSFAAVPGFTWDAGWAIKSAKPC